MLDKLIEEKADGIAYTPPELTNISASLGHLKTIVANQPDFEEPFLGGSYKRGTLVKGLSDVDVYFRYTGTGNPQAALTKLKKCLTDSYPGTLVKQDVPSILVDFNKIPFNITPYKVNTQGVMGIPDETLINWRTVHFESLEESVAKLKMKSPQFIRLIRILKFWNYSHRKGLKNFVIERRICNLFLSSDPPTVPANISHWMWIFLKNNGFQTEASYLYDLKKNDKNEANLKAGWLKFIENRK